MRNRVWCFFILLQTVSTGLAYSSGIGGGNPFMQFSKLNENYTVQIPVPNKVKTDSNSTSLDFELSGFSAKIKRLPKDSRVCVGSSKIKSVCIFEESELHSKIAIELKGVGTYLIDLDGKNKEPFKNFSSRFIESFSKVIPNKEIATPLLQKEKK